MPVSISCPVCNARRDVPDDCLGKRIRCQKCQVKFVADPPPSYAAGAEDRESDRDRRFAGADDGELRSRRDSRPPFRREGRRDEDDDPLVAERRISRAALARPPRRAASASGDSGVRSSGYVEGNLGKGEYVIFFTRLHWAVIAKAAAKSAVVLAFAMFVAIRLAGDTGVAKGNVGGVVASVLASLVAFLPSAIYRYFTSDFAVTNKRVIIKDGFLSRRSLEVFVGKVESVGVQQGFVGQALGYGDIVVNGSGGTKERFASIARPMGFRKAVQEAIP